MISKKVLVDENQQPVAVQIDYRDWLRIEEQLSLVESKRVASVNALAGTLRFPEDALAYQQRVRQEWQP